MIESAASSLYWVASRSRPRVPKSSVIAAKALSSRPSSRPSLTSMSSLIQAVKVLKPKLSLDDTSSCPCQEMPKR